MFTITTVSSRAEIDQILELQSINLRANLSEEEQASQGFVTVWHEPYMLERMHAVHPSIIAKTASGTLAGYCLVMPRSSAVDVPILAPMFATLETLEWNGRPLRDQNWFVMGQVCVAAAFRGQGVFDALYAGLREHCSPHFDFVVTEIADDNRRSLRAHARVGFETIHTYEDETTGQLWHVVLWDWT
jgi:RimJ/RimL family protein N-acetyltransferase